MKRIYLTAQDVQDVQALGELEAVDLLVGTNPARASEEYVHIKDVQPLVSQLRICLKYAELAGRYEQANHIHVVLAQYEANK